MWRTYFSASWGPDSCTRLAMSCNDNVKNVWNLESIKVLKLGVKDFPCWCFMACVTWLWKCDGKEEVEHTVELTVIKGTMRVSQFFLHSFLTLSTYGVITHSCNFILHQTVLIMSNLFSHLFTQKRWLPIPWISFKRCIYKPPYEIFFLVQQISFELAKKTSFPQSPSRINPISQLKEQITSVLLVFLLFQTLPKSALFTHSFLMKWAVKFSFPIFWIGMKVTGLQRSLFWLSKKTSWAKPPDRQTESPFK